MAAAWPDAGAAAPVVTATVAAAAALAAPLLRAPGAAASRSAVHELEQLRVEQFDGDRVVEASRSRPPAPARRSHQIAERHAHEAPLVAGDVLLVAGIDSLLIPLDPELAMQRAAAAAELDGVIGREAATARRVPSTGAATNPAELRAQRTYRRSVATDTSVARMGKPWRSSSSVRSTSPGASPNFSAKCSTRR